MSRAKNYSIKLFLIFDIFSLVKFMHKIDAQQKKLSSSDRHKPNQKNLDAVRIINLLTCFQGGCRVTFYTNSRKLREISP